MRGSGDLEWGGNRCIWGCTGEECMGISIYLWKWLLGPKWLIPKVAQPQCPRWLAVPLDSLRFVLWYSCGSHLCSGHPSCADSSKSSFRIQMVMLLPSSAPPARHGTRWVMSMVSFASFTQLVHAHSKTKWLSAHGIHPLTFPSLLFSHQMHPLIMDCVTMTAMLFQICTAFGYWSSYWRNDHLAMCSHCLERILFLVISLQFPILFHVYM